MRIYQAGPLFTAAEISWHKDFKQQLEACGYQVDWPGEFFTTEEIIAWGTAAAKNILDRDVAAIDACDVVVALLDGTQVDDGTSWEIGYAYAKGKPIVGIRTDIRFAGDTKYGLVNAMIAGSCVVIAADIHSAIKVLQELFR